MRPAAGTAVLSAFTQRRKNHEVVAQRREAELRAQLDAAVLAADQEQDLMAPGAESNIYTRSVSGLPLSPIQVLLTQGC